MKIIVAEKISQAGRKLLAQQDGWSIIGPEEFAKAPDAHLRDAEALIVRSAVQADRKLMERAPRLRVIGRAGVGVDNVDVDFATERGIVVMNTPGANAIAVAEHTLALMLGLARQIPRADETTRAGRWEKKALQGTELYKKKLGVIGLGRVGTEVARRALAMRMKVLAFDPYISQAVAEEVGVAIATLDELYGSSDYITLHVGLTPQTQKMINADSIGKMKAGVRIVNCARGELIDESALAAALESGKVAGAALDVFTEEPPKNSPLLRLSNVIATPHIAGSTEEAQEAVGVQIAKQVAVYLREAIAQNAVNVPSLSDAEYRQMRTYLHLSEKLASLLAQLSEGNLSEMRISYAGALTHWKTALIRSYAVMGLLGGRSQEVINVVNAEAQARHRGIRISEVQERTGIADLNLLSITLRSHESAVSAIGTVVHGSSSRIIELNGTDIEAPLQGNLLVLRNRDVPGVIGKVGSILGESGVNIARFALGREAAEALGRGAAEGNTAGAAASTAPRAASQNALAVIQTDVPVQGSTLERLKVLPEILMVKPVAL